MTLHQILFISGLILGLFMLGTGIFFCIRISKEKKGIHLKRHNANQSFSGFVVSNFKGWFSAILIFTAVVIILFCVVMIASKTM